MKVVSTANAPAAIGPYSQALDLGDLVFVSGQLPVDPATGVMPDTIEAQAAQSLANLRAILGQRRQDGHLPGRYQRLCRRQRRLRRGVRPALPGPQLRAGGGHPQGRPPRDRVHRQKISAQKSGTAGGLPRFYYAVLVALSGAEAAGWLLAAVSGAAGSTMVLWATWVRR